jgi:hypothetical protein
MGFVFISEQTATCATYNINWLVFITKMKSVYCAVRTGSLNKAVCASSKIGSHEWWGPLTLITSEGSFPGVKRTRHESDYSPQCRAAVNKQCAELKLNHPTPARLGAWWSTGTNAPTVNTRYMRAVYVRLSTSSTLFFLFIYVPKALSFYS